MAFGIDLFGNFPNQRGCWHENAAYIIPDEKPNKEFRELRVKKYCVNITPSEIDYQSIKA
jgi:hypothetical protein